jgi:phosphopantothenoylcysteine decarboxylase / phosphopantothenate---cysteine ligase
MGYAIAEELAARGAKVELVSGPVAIKPLNANIKITQVISALEMLEQCKAIFPSTNGAVMCAAVADYRPVMPMDSKVKRENDNFTIELQPNPDIAATLGQSKKDGQMLIGFALETDNELSNAHKKLVKKNLDFIVLNSLNDPGAGFQTVTNKITIIDRDNKTLFFELKSKQMVAFDIVNHIECKMAL